MDPTLQAIILFVAGLFGTSYSAAVGGLSLITVPALIFVGVSPLTAIATNLAAQFLPNLVAIFNYRRHKKLKISKITSLALLFILGAIAGTFIALNLADGILRIIIAIFIIVSIFLVLSKGKIELHPVKKIKPLQPIFIFLIGAYKTIFGASAKTITMAYLTAIKGMNFVESSAAGSFLMFFPIVVGSILFVIENKVDWVAFAPLTLGCIIGAFIGSQLAVKKGDHYVRILLIIVAVIGLITIFI